MPESTEQDFIEIRQKDYILHLIQKKKLSEAKACLLCLKEQWEVNGYSYKTKELMDRIDDEELS